MAVATRHTNVQTYENSRDTTDGYRSDYSYPRYEMSDASVPIPHTGNSISASDFDSFDYYTQSSRHVEYSSKPLTTRECVELFQESIDETYRAMAKAAGNEGLAALQPKITLDMSKKNIASLPSEVVPMITQEVERYISQPSLVMDVLLKSMSRLKLANNQLKYIAPEFAACTWIKYISLRANRFTEIPQSVNVTTDS